MSVKTNIRVVRFSQKHSMLSEAYEIFSTVRKETGHLEDVAPAAGSPSTVQSALVGMSRGRRDVSPPASLPNFSHAFIISHCRNG